MSQSESADLLSRLYNELSQHIVQQCVQEFQSPTFLSQLDLEERLAASIESAVQKASNSSQTQELEQQVEVAAAADNCCAREEARDQSGRHPDRPSVQFSLRSNGSPSFGAAG